MLKWRSLSCSFIATTIATCRSSKTSDLVEKLRAQKVGLEGLIIPDEIHDLLRWSDWIRAYCATAEFFDRSLAASGERR
jgi:hypothetical protein